MIITNNQEFGNNLSDPVIMIINNKTNTRNMTTKQEIFKVFYWKEQKSRSGGGKLALKMTRRTVTKDIQDETILKIGDDAGLLKYYNKLLTRDPSLAPPPEPK